MYEAVRTAVHRVDRHAQVATGGLAWTMSSLPRLLKAFKDKPMDGANVSRCSYQTLIGLAKLHLAYVLPFDGPTPTWGLTDGTYARALKAITGR